MLKRKYLTQSEIEMLLTELGKHTHAARNICMMFMGFIHGFRVSELLSLKLSDVDLDSRSLRVQRLKNGFSTIHPMVSREIQLIRQWLKERPNYLPRTPQANNEIPDWLFLSRTGQRMSRQQVYKIIRQTSLKAKLSICANPHMLRHACGYALADNGVDTRLIQDYLGHRNIRHTVRYTASNAGRFETVWDGKGKRKQLTISTKLSTTLNWLILNVVNFFLPRKNYASLLIVNLK
ncbi:tyrosine-type recombinase/integrase [Xenorhabdus bovienii]|uniref:tyrosine-type DNA invertase n=2 Tax=Xenorhabdus bovienii TaxID=40576 RepID=UPI0023B2A9A9|nr:tyrosine-type DNA invertase [Xenorhabdus bovienii]MDE9434748.1 tyrosine-type recombinase/integrase [Xenorhabdus bovienii]MDE9496332.1 tyrosine-type recombinase/integrase [Xenorhabdus bovienii]MDE9586872.1 tyrosine-type recombinase/integrase [Xenorhabdus bovienii]